MTEDEIGKVAVDLALRVHRQLGPGLLETVYEAALAMEFARRGLSVARQVEIPVQYLGEPLGVGYRADLLVEAKVLLELKSVESMAPVHRKQVLTYLRLGNFRLGYLINFGVPLLKQGIERLVNRLSE